MSNPQPSLEHGLEHCLASSILPAKRSPKRLLFGLLIACTAALGLTTSCSEEPAQAASAAKAAVSPTVETAPPRVVDTSDLSGMQRRGTLRIAVLADIQIPLPRQTTPGARERQLAVAFAREQNLRPEFIHCESRDQLIQVVLRGEADMVASSMTVTRSRKEQLAFSRPTRVVREVVVGRRGAKDLPRSIAELAGREVFVWGRSSYAETVRELAKSKAPSVHVVPTRPQLDDETLLYLLAQGKFNLTICDADVVASFVEFDDAVEELFTVHEGRQIAWGMRKLNPNLLAAANTFVVSHAMAAKASPANTSDLESIKSRGTLRVLTRNNSISYFLHQGQALGFDHELARMISKKLGVRLEMVVPPTAKDLIPWLEQGRGDMIAASLTVTPDRAQRIAFSKPYLFVDEVVAARKGTKALQIATLKGLPLHIRPTSSYAQTLRKLSGQYGPLQVVAADESLETEQLLHMVSAGTIPATVTDSHILQVEQAYAAELTAVLRLTAAPPGATDTIGKPRTEGKSIAFGVRRDNPKLKAWLDRFVKAEFRGLAYNVAKKRYFSDTRSIRKAHRSTAKNGRISDFDNLFRKYAKLRGLDWRLVAAQTFVESRFDANAKSWAGARGLMQIMPATGKEMGYTLLEDPETSVKAGTQYLAGLIDRFDEHLPLETRIHFALASYNGGRGHILDAMRLARQRGLDPDVWFDNVEEAILLLEDRKIARKARYGYCRGSEVKGYVRRIQKHYADYVRLVPE